MDRGGAPRASPQAECDLPSTQGGEYNTSSEADQGGRKAEATGDKAGDGARCMGGGYSDDQGGKIRKKSDKGNEGKERIRGAGIRRGRQGGGQGVGQAED